jgi:lipid A disaccharide synthetase
MVIYRPTSYAVLGRAQVIVRCTGTATLEAALGGLAGATIIEPAFL